MALDDISQWADYVLQRCERDVGFRQWIELRLVFLREKNPTLPTVDKELLSVPTRCTNIAEVLLQQYDNQFGYAGFSNEGPARGV